MADKASFGFELKDETSAAANSSAASLEHLKKSVQDAEAEYRALGQAMGRLKGATGDFGAAKKQLTERMGHLKSQMATNQTQFAKLGGSMQDLGKKSDTASAGANKAGGSMQGAGDKAQGAGGKFGVSGAQIAKGIAVAVAAIAGAWSAFSRFALMSWDTIRTQRITAEAFTGSAENAGALELHIARLGARLPQTRAALHDMAQSLSEGGLQGNDMVLALKSIATASAVLPAAGAKLKSIAEAAVQTRRMTIGMFDLKGTGISLDAVASKLAASMKTTMQAAKNALANGRVDITAGLKALDAAVADKFGNLSGRAALSLSSQWEKLKESAGNLFSKINFEPVLKALATIGDLLSDQSVTGQALQAIFTTLFGGMGDSVGTLAGLFKGFFQGMVFQFLNMQNLWLRAKITLMGIIPPSLFARINLVKVGFYAGAIAAFALTAAVAAFAAVALVSFLILAAPVLIVVGLFGLIGYAISRVAGTIKSGFMTAVTWVKAKVAAVWSFISSIDLASAGAKVIAGFIEGMWNAPANVAKIGIKLGKSLVDGVKSIWQMNSPSKVALRMGGDFAQSLGDGTTNQAEHFQQATKAFFPEVDAGKAGATIANTTTNNKTNAPTMILQFNGIRDRGMFERSPVVAELRRALNGAGLSAASV